MSLWKGAVKHFNQHKVREYNLRGYKAVVRVTEVNLGEYPDSTNDVMGEGEEGFVNVSYKS